MFVCNPAAFLLQIDSAKFTDPHTKVNALLQTHFSRVNLTGGCNDRMPGVFNLSLKNMFKQMHASATAKCSTLEND